MGKGVQPKPGLLPGRLVVQHLRSCQAKHGRCGLCFLGQKKLDDGWPESEKDVFQAALRMVVVKDRR